MRRLRCHDQFRLRTARQRGLGHVLNHVAAGMLIATGGIVVANALGTYLIVRDPLEPAGAIVVLAGGFPIREWEAAELYRAGWAPRIVLVREWLDDPSRRRPTDRPSLEDRRSLLGHLGVPGSAIVVASEPACMTADELDAATRALTAPERPVILVTSKYHARRVSVLWRQAVHGAQRGLVQPRPATRSSRPPGISIAASWSGLRVNTSGWPRRGCHFPAGRPPAARISYSSRSCWTGW